MDKPIFSLALNEKKKKKKTKKKQRNEKNIHYKSTYAWWEKGKDKSK